MSNILLFKNSKLNLQFEFKFEKYDFSEPSIRGILMATTTIAAGFGIAATYFLGSQMSWRNAALICASVPTLSIILISFVI